MIQQSPASAEPIVINLTPPEIKVVAGAEPVEMTANVRNAGNTVDQYSIEIENLDPSWYTIGVQSVSLFPGDSAPIPIKLHPPKGSNTRAGHYTFVVRARSHADPTLVGVTKGVVQVGSYANFQIDLAPKRVTAYRGKYRLSITNGGNGEAAIELSGRDAESNLVYNFKNATPTVQPGTKLVVPVTVKPRGLHLIGEEQRHQFGIIAMPVDGEEKDAKEVQGELVHKPPIRNWKKPLIALVVLFLLLAVLLSKPNFCSLPQPIGGWACNFGSAIAGMFRQTRAEKVACASGPGFNEVRLKYENVVGKCAEDEWYDGLGNSHQRTTTGQLMFIKQSQQIYFFGDDTKIWTFESCSPKGTFNNCDVVEVKKTQ